MVGKMLNDSHGKSKVDYVIKSYNIHDSYIVYIVESFVTLNSKA
jgi:hypothetical protein